MRTLCCSDICERRPECARHAINNKGTHSVIDFYRCDSEELSSNNRYREYHWCGERGNWERFESLKLTEEEFVRLYCSKCGSQRCEGIGTEWFDGCKFKNMLSEV